MCVCRYIDTYIYRYIYMFVYGYIPHIHMFVHVYIATNTHAHTYSDWPFPPLQWTPFHIRETWSITAPMDIDSILINYIALPRYHNAVE